MRALLLAVVCATACLAGSNTAASGAGCDPSTAFSLVSKRATYAARVVRPVNVFRRPGRHRIQAFGRTNVNGVPTVFSVLGVRTDRDCQPRWYRVKLPLRPNGIAGWVRARDVVLKTVRSRIVIDLSERRLTLFRDGRPAIVTATAIGSSGTPTPTGRFYVNQRFVPQSPYGVFGARVLGISAFSPTLRGWPQGGPIAIHGTNNPESIGFAVSHGCVRIRNEDVLKVFRLAPAGTPVRIRM